MRFRSMHKLVAAVCVALSITSCGQKLSPQETELVKKLTVESIEVQREIVAAEAEASQFQSGLLGLLIKSRVEILKTNHALIEQRIHSIETGAKVTLEVRASSIDLERANALEAEISKQESSIAKAETDTTGSGGLIGVMNAMVLSTERNSLAMLKQQYLVQKYGLATPALKPEQPKDAGNSVSRTDRALAAPITREVANNAKVKDQILIPTLLRKRLSKENYRDFVSLEISFNPQGLDKPARALKGVLRFTDLFDEQKFALNWTVETPTVPGVVFTEAGSGFDYNQFIDSHRWVNSTSIDNMKLKFSVESVIYQDGTKRQLD